MLMMQGGDIVVNYMRWGLVPAWHKGDARSFKMSMINARKETLGEKASFRRPLEHGQRCVVLAEGFYEWETSNDGKTKQPHYVFFPPGTKDPPPLGEPIPKERERVCVYVCVCV